MDQVSERLRIAVWNMLFQVFLSNTNAVNGRVKAIVDELRWDQAEFWAGGSGRLVDRLKVEFLTSAQSWDFYDTLDAVARGLSGLHATGETDYWAMWNKPLIEERAAFRFVSGQLVPLTNEAEIAEVECALRSPLQSVREHIETALGKLAERPTPDVRNAIKESISAVEAALKVTTGRSQGDLAKALPDFETKFGELHPAFRMGIEKLYAYTNDEKGLRHSLLEAGAKVDGDDAQFMLIACSALSNFLIARASTKGWKALKG